LPYVKLSILTLPQRSQISRHSKWYGSRWKQQMIQRWGSGKHPKIERQIHTSLHPHDNLASEPISVHHVEADVDQQGQDSFPISGTVDS